MKTMFGKKKSLETLRLMLVSRRFEEKVNEMFMQGQIHGTTHLGIGQEAMHGGLSAALADDDWILPNHRGHGHCIAKGATPYQIMSELFATEDGVCKGMGGSMHIIDTEHCNMGSSGIVGSAIPMAVGMALSLKQQGQNSVVVPIFGDAASNRGTFHEALNMAAIWKLPIIFVCENNLYGMSVPAKYAVAVEDIADRAASYGMESRIIDGNDVLEVYYTIKELTESMRNGGGPVLVEAKTYRWLGHSKSDRREYRTKDEEAEWKERCPILGFKNKCIEAGFITEAGFEKMDEKIEEELDEMVELCRQKSPISLEEALSYVTGEQV
ncbi:MAG: thiamine pyrophosphate-dependent dehydrogenase E1 component subunit alpha [Spirochaetales bacterium]|nr:thiamine pyrophosphate-dependent dehydrogenase E1 component subunit alpha [Spirochaetales bacterium]